jgi:hypothetical protein
MKHCPACNFSFPDFYRVCDFDGTELVKDSEPRSLVKVKTPRPSRFRQSLKSPVLWAGLLLIAVVSSAFLLAYYNATSLSTSVMRTLPTSASPASAMPDARASDQSPALIKTPVPAKRGSVTGAQASRLQLNTLPRSPSASLRPKATAPRSQARLHQSTSVGNRSRKSEIAGRRDDRRGRQLSDNKEPKLVAILKTTWNVLKKPFKF